MCWREGAGPAQAQGCILWRRGERRSPAVCADHRLVLTPSLLLLWGPLHGLLDLLLLLAGSRGQWRLPRHVDHGALGREDHHWRHILHGTHFMADDLLGTVAGPLALVAGGASTVAGGALGAVAASVSTGAHFLVGKANSGKERPLSLDA